MTSDAFASHLSPLLTPVARFRRQWRRVLPARVRGRRRTVVPGCSTRARSQPGSIPGRRELFFGSTFEAVNHRIGPQCLILFNARSGRQPSGRLRRTGRVSRPLYGEFLNSGRMAALPDWGSADFLPGSPSVSEQGDVNAGSKIDRQPATDAERQSAFTRTGCERASR